MRWSWQGGVVEFGIRRIISDEFLFDMFEKKLGWREWEGWDKDNEVWLDEKEWGVWVEKGMSRWGGPKLGVKYVIRKIDCCD